MIRNLLTGKVKKTDSFGRKIPKKIIQKEIMKENREKGKRAESIAKTKLSLAGYETKKVHKGRDFVATRTNFWTGKKEKLQVEVKANNSPLSKAQKNMKKRHGKNYIVLREKVN